MSVTLLTGDIYLGINPILGKEVAIKVESLKASVATVRWQLRFFAPCMAILTIYGAKFWTNGNTTEGQVFAA